jgi:hypothetical protein
MKALVAFIADDEFYIVVVIVFLADLAGHVLESFVPLLCRDVGRFQS